MAPAVRQAFNDDPADDRLELVYGSRPRLNIIGIAIAGIVAGSLIAGFGPNFAIKQEINWPAVLVGVAFATLIRRYLFRSAQARAEDFPWLAASLAPAVVLLMAVSMVSRFAGGPDGPDTVSTIGLGNVLVAITDALGVAAAFTIAVTALCYSRNWLQALWDLAVRLLVFRIMVWVTALVMLEIGVVGPIVSGLLRGVFGIRLPDWLPELFDQLSYAALLSVVYLAVIGATWTVGRKSFDELLATGQVDILATIAAMAEDPEKLRKKKEKKAKKRLKRQQSKRNDKDPGS